MMMAGKTSIFSGGLVFLSILMAFGARLAGGSTSGQGISGTMQLNAASWIAASAGVAVPAVAETVTQAENRVLFGKRVTEFGQVRREAAQPGKRLAQWHELAHKLGTMSEFDKRRELEKIVRFLAQDIAGTCPDRRRTANCVPALLSPCAPARRRGTARPRCRAPP